MTELESLLAEQACARLIVDYCNRVDAGDYRAVVALFSKTGVLKRPMEGAMVGHAAILAFLEALPDIRRRHVSSNLVVTLTGVCTATALSYLTAYDSPQSDGLAVLEAPYLIAEYHDRFLREDGTWRFAERETVPVFRAMAR